MGGARLMGHGSGAGSWHGSSRGLRTPWPATLAVTQRVRSQALGRDLFGALFGRLAFMATFVPGEARPEVVERNSHGSKFTLPTSRERSTNRRPTVGDALTCTETPVASRSSASVASRLSARGLPRG